MPADPPPGPAVSATAAALIAEFGSFPGVLAATRRAQMRATGGDTRAVSLIAAFRQAMRHALRTDLRQRPLMPNMTAVLDYLRAELAYAGDEHFRVLFLDVRHRLIRDEEMWTGTVDQCQVHIRTIVKRALELDANGLILVHNHPSGDVTPSRSDTDLTRAVAAATKTVGVSVIDHLIIGSTGHASMVDLGLW
ncbi:DNA repair protein RadC [Sphingomonas sp. So64.6b]|uniref:JAB domain-containing protein n=1 Tax=Sphingomonas sp. So64.6b TaxID=2997354 RepID=UPI0015FF33C9|nr:DNA repair protein RadC [Sphingomonas sp. So64.6b]QNA82720.1 DNA repair protein RadC [Sphingomonas sp. So64.6b]